MKPMLAGVALASALTSSAGRAPCGQAMSCALRTRCSRCDRRRPIRLAPGPGTGGYGRKRLSETQHNGAAVVLHVWQSRMDNLQMKTLTVRLPEALVTPIEAAALQRFRHVRAGDVERHFDIRFEARFHCSLKLWLCFGKDLVAPPEETAHLFIITNPTANAGRIRRASVLSLRFALHRGRESGQDDHSARNR